VADERRSNALLLAAINEQGLTQDELAAQVNRCIHAMFGESGRCTDTQVRRWTSGAVRWPQPRYLLALERILDRRALDLGFIPTSAASVDHLTRARATLPAAQPQEDDAVRRRRFIGLAAGTAFAKATEATEAAPLRGRVGLSHISMLQASLAGLHALDDQYGGGDLANIAIRRYSQIGDTLTACTYGEKVGRALFSMAGEFASSAGWFAFDSGDQGAAEKRYDQALRLSILANDSTLQAHVLIAMAVQAVYTGRAVECVAIARTALSHDAARHHPLMAAMFHARAGIGLARSGEGRLSARSFTAAQRALDRRTDSPVPPWLTFFGPGELSGLTAQSHLALGNYAEAEQSSRETLTLINPRYGRNRFLYMITRAEAHLAGRNVEEACATATKALDVAQGSRLRCDRGMQNLLRFRRKLEAYAHVPAVRSFLDDWGGPTPPPPGHHLGM
jgi:tetratricopeptide (TPR) repeat protein